MLQAPTVRLPEDRIQLPSDLLPTNYYNIQADLPEPLPPPLDPKTLQPINPAMLERLFAKELIRKKSVLNVSSTFLKKSLKPTG